MGDDKQNKIPDDIELPEGMDFSQFFTNAKMYLNFIKQFKDPWDDPVRLACVADSLFLMMSRLYPDGDSSDSPTFQGLLPSGECRVLFTDELDGNMGVELKPGEVITKYDVITRRLLVIAEHLESESPEQRKNRRVTLHREFWPSVQKAMRDTVVEMAGSIPVAAQDRFMSNYPAPSHQNVRNESKRERGDEKSNSN